jgi:superfamily II DNA or RNA helicase
MQLAVLLAKRFKTTISRRGYDYFRQRRVRNMYGSATDMGAQVLGSDSVYKVLLQWTKGQLAVLCECPYFVDQAEPCKHLWAAVLAADAENYLSDAAKERELTLDIDSLLDGFAAPDAAPDAVPAAKPASVQRRPPANFPPPPQPAAWKKQLSGILKPPAATVTWQGRWREDAEILYVVDIPNSQAKENLVLALESREPKKSGGWKNAKPLTLNRQMAQSVPGAADREILSLLLGGGKVSSYVYYDTYDQAASSYHVPAALAQVLVPKVIRTGRCLFPHESDQQNLVSLSWDEGEPWKFVLSMQETEKNNWLLRGEFRRGAERMDLTAPRLITPGGFLFASDHVAPLAQDASFDWIAILRKEQPVLVPVKDRDEFLAELFTAPILPQLELPEELQCEQVTVVPRPCLKIMQQKVRYGSKAMSAELSFDYAGRSIPEKDARQGIYDGSARRFIRRDGAAERAAANLLPELGLRYRAAGWSSEAGWELAPAKLPRIVRALVEAGWHIVADGKLFRPPGITRAEVASGVDWFELHGEVEYGDAKAQLPQLLLALKRGETMVVLDDGSYGLLPEEWLRRFGAVAGMGEADGDHIRFSSSQAGLLDALLAAQPAIDCDAAFQHVRKQLDRFQQVTAAEQPAGFVGQLRGYQCEGLGWMHFLRQFSFGGCLADDMGVGKTAQVLALLETRRVLRAAGELSKPSLAVVPKSLIFNWKQEVERFTPQLQVLDYTGSDRKRQPFAGFDLILTTYGTLRRDALHFKDEIFDYLILDEAQAVKNSATESAKAVRLLRGDYRLALSGTPVENHLGELWSLFEFLNPGLLGASSAFQLTGGAMRNPDEETRQLLARALRPFFLRRTKEQVAKELPAKIEQTIYCEMEPHQRALYNDLRQHYRDALLRKIDADGIAKSKIMVLEALLRLRQAACHPGLIDPKLAKDSSAKLDVLLDRLREVLDEGHKALVFSQFTSLLAILRARLDRDGTTYEYLDGKTRDRQACVDRFQTAADCQLFLISIKAGGLGLNLTAADYVFILDPWWNPAVEAQAVDRAHRIGQARQVFAYRLIARDTVEEKVLELQQTKRNLADAIIGAQSSLIRNLRAEDIELLLS